MAIDSEAAAAAANGGPPPAQSGNGHATPPDELVGRVQELTAELERVADPKAQAAAENLLAAVIELYGEGLERIFTAVAEAGEPGEELISGFTNDGVVASLMLIHDLYPVDLTQRVNDALDSVRPYMESHGGNVELLEVSEGIARIALQGSCESCPASASTLELAIKQALDEYAPDLEGLVVEGDVQDPHELLGSDAMELPVVQVAPGNPDAEPSWFDLNGVDGLGEGSLTRSELNGIGLLVARIEGDLLAYRDHCVGCGQVLSGGSLEEGVLTCPSCERRYLLPRAGRALGDERLNLEPVPLLQGERGIRVALAA